MKKFRIRHDSGFSLVGVLVALALLSLIAVTAGQSFINSMRSRVRLSSKLNFEEVNQSVLKVLQNMARNPPAAGCYTNADLTQNVVNYPFIAVNPQVAAGISATAAAALNSPRFAFASAAVERCKVQKLVSSPASLTDNSMYFCLRFNQDPTHSSASISGSPHAFAEIKILLTDAHTNQGTSCNNFKSFTQGVMQVYYSLYWASDMPGGIEYNQRNSYFYVNK